MKRYKYRLRLRRMDVQVELGADTLLKGARKLSHRLQLPEGSTFEGWSKNPRGWVRFETGPVPRSIMRHGVVEP